MARNENQRMSASFIHAKLQIPYAYLRTVLNELARHDIITSSRGRNGGYRLGKDKSKIFLADIIEATEGLESFRKCFMGFDKCPFNYGCIMHPVWVRIREEILDLLKVTSLADLLHDNKN